MYIFRANRHWIWHMAVLVLINGVLLILLKGIFLLHMMQPVLSDPNVFYYWPRARLIIIWAIKHSNQLFTAWCILFLVIHIAWLYHFLTTRFSRVADRIKFVLAAGLVLLLTEGGLRLAGFIPTLHTKAYYFTPVDSLYLLQGATTDADGILKIDTSARNIICRQIREKNPDWNFSTQIDAFSLAAEHIYFLEGKIHNDLSEFYFRLCQKDPHLLTDFEKAVIDYIHCPINEDGFRSIAFKPLCADKPRLLLLGDSFTWGHSSSVKTNSFADILLAMGYVVYNSGISATDVAQYLAVARKYIPLLQPDYVIVNFYLGNDITYYRREILPYRPLLYPTNAGILMACPHGKYFESPEAAYRFMWKQWSIPKNQNLFNQIMAQTALTTQLWKILFKLKITYNSDDEIISYYAEAEKRKYPLPYCNVELQEIYQLARAFGAKYILSCIPEVYRFVHRSKADFPDLFGSLPYVEMQVEKKDYVLSNGHFNDRGHRKYALFIDSLIVHH